jgi:DNA polymerase III delta prime subunit
MESIRPNTLSEFVGQEQAVGILKVHLASARKRNAPMPHLLMAGPPGLGKTSLAKIVASETGGRLLETVGGTLKTPADVGRLMGGLRHGDIVFSTMPCGSKKRRGAILFGDGGRLLTVEDKSCGQAFQGLGTGNGKATDKKHQETSHLSQWSGDDTSGGWFRLSSQQVPFDPDLQRIRWRR